MPTPATAKEERQYRHILESEVKAGKSKKTAKRIAAATVNKRRAAKKAAKKPARRAQRNGLYAYQVSVIQPGEGARRLGAFPAKSRAEALQAAENELKRKGQWYRGSKLLTAAVPLNSSAARHANTTISNPKGWSKTPQALLKYGVSQIKKLTNGKYEVRFKDQTGRLIDHHSQLSLPTARSVHAKNLKALRAKALLKSSAVKRPATKKRRRNSATAEENRREFSGTFSGYKELYFPANTPTEGLSTLGPLVLINTDAGLIKPVGGTAVLVQDAKGKLYIGSKTNAPIIDGPAKEFGRVHRVEYVCAKPHLGYPEKVTWFHDFEAPLPHLKSDGAGGLHFHGGGYTIRREGITG